MDRETLLRLYPLPEPTTTFILTPAPGTTWGMTADTFLDALRRRQGGEAEIQTHADGGPSDKHGWWFGFTVGDVGHDGAGSSCLGGNEGVSIFKTTVDVAAEFAAWVCAELVPDGAAVDFNSRVGMEAGLPDELLTARTVQDLEAVFREHIENAA
ncbi:hypothetical protein [Streptomyces novaecaesareae]|uniref:hypothetical protein n=1 Tax=Streptomyces novaecaesareae TaxID=68244 RepID=UPI0004AB02D9|nr:hypothetical protein [Streptomyces novaecaesareae]